MRVRFWSGSNNCDYTWLTLSNFNENFKTNQSSHLITFRLQSTNLTTQQPDQPLGSDPFWPGSLCTLLHETTGLLTAELSLSHTAGDFYGHLRTKPALFHQKSERLIQTAVFSEPDRAEAPNSPRTSCSTDTHSAVTVLLLYWWMWYFYFYKLYMYLHHSYCYVCSYNHNQVDPVLSVEQQSAVRWPPTRNEPLNWPQACDELMHDTMHVIYCTIRDTTNDYYH